MKGKPKHLSLRIDEDLLRKFEYVAKYDDRSMNWYLLHRKSNFSVFLFTYIFFDVINVMF